jgi:hypothetical protein
MPIASTLAWVKGQVNGLAMPGINTPSMVAYITPPDPNDEAQYPTAYVWPTDGRESRENPGTIPRNTGPDTPSGFKPINHMIDVFIVWFQADDDPDADSLFPGIVDAVMAALRTSPDSETLTDPYTGGQSTLYDLGEQITYQIFINSLADQAYDRYDCLLRCTITELIQA